MPNAFKSVARDEAQKHRELWGILNEGKLHEGKLTDIINAWCTANGIAREYSGSVHLTLVKQGPFTDALISGGSASADPKTGKGTIDALLYHQDPIIFHECSHMFLFLKKHFFGLSYLGSDKIRTIISQFEPSGARFGENTIR